MHFLFLMFFAPSWLLIFVDLKKITKIISLYSQIQAGMVFVIYVGVDKLTNTSAKDEAGKKCAIVISDTVGFSLSVSLSLSLSTLIESCFVAGARQQGRQGDHFHRKGQKPSEEQRHPLQGGRGTIR